MTQYNIITIKCFKELTPIDIYNIINEMFVFNNYIFEIYNLFKYLPTVPNAAKKRYEELEFNKYEYRVTNQLLKDTDYYNPERHDFFLISNTDSSWEYPNSGNLQKLEKSSFFDIVSFCSKLKKIQYSTYMLGFDEIEWGGASVRKGTYGFSKARSTFSGGENYLSNSIIVSKIAYENKPLTVYLSCESKYRESKAVNDIISYLGKIYSEKVLYAPDDEDERKVFEREYQIAEKKFDEVISKFRYNFDEISAILPYDVKSTHSGISYSEKLNVKKAVKNVFAESDWIYDKESSSDSKIYLYKKQNDIKISVYIDATHLGHYLQFVLILESPMYCFEKNPAYSFDLSNETEIKEYLSNVRVICDYFCNWLLNEDNDLCE